MISSRAKHSRSRLGPSVWSVWSVDISGKAGGRRRRGKGCSRNAECKRLTGVGKQTHHMANLLDGRLTWRKFWSTPAPKENWGPGAMANKYGAKRATPSSILVFYTAMICGWCSSYLFSTSSSESLTYRIAPLIGVPAVLLLSVGLKMMPKMPDIAPQDAHDEALLDRLSGLKLPLAYVAAGIFAIVGFIGIVRFSLSGGIVQTNIKFFGSRSLTILYVVTACVMVANIIAQEIINHMFWSVVRRSARRAAPAPA